MPRGEAGVLHELAANAHIALAGTFEREGRYQGGGPCWPGSSGSDGASGVTPQARRGALSLARRRAWRATALPAAATSPPTSDPFGVERLGSEGRPGQVDELLGIRVENAGDAPERRATSTAGGTLDSLDGALG